jgi:integrase/recombinase XerC
MKRATPSLSIPPQTWPAAAHPSRAPSESTGAAHPNGEAAKDLRTLEQGAQAFLRALSGQNKSPATIRAYGDDVGQFITWLHANTVVVRPADIARVDITEYLGHLARRGLSGISRARKLAGIREYFRFLENHDIIAKSPAAGVETPKKEKHARSYLRPDEYRALLAHAGANPRDYCILQVFLQTGIRLSELCALTRDDVDLDGRTITVRGKGQVERGLAPLRWTVDD